MNRALGSGLGIGLVAGGALRVAFGSNWFLVVAVIALYTGGGYFAVGRPELLSREFPAFDRSADRLGWAIGLFGAGIVPVAVGRQFAADGGNVEFFVVYLGVVGFLLVSSVAAVDAEID